MDDFYIFVIIFVIGIVINVYRFFTGTLHSVKDDDFHNSAHLRMMQRDQDQQFQQFQDQMWRDNTPFEHGGNRTDLGNSWNDSNFGGGCGMF